MQHPSDAERFIQSNGNRMHFPSFCRTEAPLILVPSSQTCKWCFTILQRPINKFSLLVNQLPPPKIKTLVHKIFTMAEGKPLKMQLKCPLMIVYMSAGSRVGGRSIQANLVLPGRRSPAGSLVLHWAGPRQEGGWWMGNLILKLLTYLQIQECSDRVMWGCPIISIMANMAIGQAPTANVKFLKIFANC